MATMQDVNRATKKAAFRGLFLWRFFLGLLLVVSCRVCAYESIVKYYDSDSSASAACDAFLVSVSSTGYCYSTSTGYRTFYSGDYYSFDVIGDCEGYAYTDVDGQCTDEEPDYCADNELRGSVWDSESESCVCPDGQTDVFGPDGYRCETELPDCVAGTAQHIGWLGDTPVCDYNGFCADGESGGLVNGQWACISDSCDGGTYINGNCIFPEDTTSQPQTDYLEGDTDGDGITDSYDEDIDGDGVPNSQDSDADGDGVADVDAPLSEQKGSATAVGGCDAPPVCTGGDPQLCAVLKQQWYQMCAGDFQEPQAGEFSTAAQDRFDAAQQEFDELLESIGSELSGYFDFGVSSGSGVLPDDNRNILGVDVNFSISRFAGLLSSVGSVLYFACTLLAAFIVLRRG